MKTNESAGHCISWSAIIIGALVAVGVSFLLNLFSIAIGLSLVKSTTNGLETLAVGGFIGLLIGCVCALFTSGLVAGYLGRCFHGGNAGSHIGVIYGFSAWCLALVLSVLLASAFGRFTGNYFNFVTHPTEQVMSGLHTDDTYSEKMITAQKAQKLGGTAMLVFSLFFAGALSSCFGGYFGMACDEYCRIYKRRK